MPVTNVMVRCMETLKARGFCNEPIARLLGINESTVRYHTDSNERQRRLLNKKKSYERKKHEKVLRLQNG